MILLQQMMVLFLIMIVGFLCRRKGLLNDESSRKLSGIVVNVANPALILSSGINQESSVQGKELVQTMLLALGMYAGLLLFAWILTRALRTPEKERGIYQVMTVFSNIGFMGFPVIAAVYGKEALLYASLFLIPYNVLIYTYGIRVMKGKDEETTGIQWGKIFNIGVIACIASMVIYVLRIPMPVFIEDAADMLGSLTAPLSMMIIGDSFAGMNLKKLFLDKRLLVFSGIKLLLVPIVCTLLLGKVLENPMLVGVCMIMLATPVGSMTAMLAQQYGADSELTTRGVALTTILSVITIPIVSGITG